MDISKRLLALGALACVVAVPAGAQVNWATWTSAANGTTSGSASGSMGTGTGTVGVTYSGNVTFANTNNTGTNYWTPAATFTNATSGAGPSTPDLIALTGGTNTGTNTLTFSTPVNNLFMAIVSLGPGSQFIFNQPFTIVGQGTDLWGGSNTSLTQSGMTLNGQEGSGVIQFTGPVSSVSWTDPHAEFWHGITVGIGAQTSTVPEPSSLALLGTGLVSLMPMVRRRRK